VILSDISEYEILRNGSLKEIIKFQLQQRLELIFAKENWVWGESKEDRFRFWIESKTSISHDDSQDISELEVLINKWLEESVAIVQKSRELPDISYNFDLGASRNNLSIRETNVVAQLKIVIISSCQVCSEVFHTEVHHNFVIVRVDNSQVHLRDSNSSSLVIIIKDNVISIYWFRNLDLNVNWIPLFPALYISLHVGEVLNTLFIAPNIVTKADKFVNIKKA